MEDSDLDVKLYSELSRKKLYKDEAREARNNLVGFFDLLYKIDRRNLNSKEAYKNKYINTEPTNQYKEDHW